MLTVEVLNCFDEKALREIILVRGKAFPNGWTYDDEKEYYGSMLEKDKNINILLQDNGKTAGYLLAIPHNEAFCEIGEDDPEMKEDSGRYYVETLVILPEFQKGSGFSRMLYKMRDEAEKRFGVNKFSMHARVSNGLSKVIQKVFNKEYLFTQIRRVERWRYYNHEEPADYIEAIYYNPATNKQNSQHKEIMGIYTSLEEAKVEVWKRWNNVSLSKKVLDYLGEIPEALKKEPRAVLFRHIMTSNIENMHFQGLANKTNLKPLGWEYLEDKFCTRNADKVALGKMPFLDRRNGKEHMIFHYRKIIDLMTAEKKMLNEIKTIFGENLVDFHHRLLKSGLPTIDIYDASSWYKTHGKKAKEYYKYFLSLFICHGVLFENFVTSKEEEIFLNTVVMPAYEQVIKHFGVKPLVVQLLPSDKAADKYWRCYPVHLEEEVNKCLQRINRLK